MRRTGAVVAALAMSLVPAAARAGGLARPNIVSARGVSLGGAFVAVADDATAWYFNPAGAAFAAPNVHVGAELVIAPRNYVPIDAAGTRGAAQEPETPIVPLPVVGVIWRVSDRVTAGAGVWNTFGGQLDYCADRAACNAEHATDGLAGVVDNVQNAVIELDAGVAYRISDDLAIGGTVRLGYGLFKVLASTRPTDSEVSSTGVGLGAALGAMWKASPQVTVAASWRSALTVDTSGDGTVGDDDPKSVDFTQEWPQSASLGVAFAATPHVTVASQVDWTQWSRLERLDVVFPAADFVQTYPLDWNDSYGVRAGVEWRQSPRLALRGGLYFDSSAVPDYTIERQYLDQNKLGLSYGASYGFGAFRVDAGGDLVGLVGGSPRTVPDNSADVGGFGALRNVSPGEYSGKVLTFELALVRRL